MNHIYKNRLAFKSMKIVTILLMCASISVFAQGTGTGGGGSANNVVSGSGTGTAFDATKSYTFSGTTNTFTGPLSVNPGPLLVGTNVDLDSSAVLYIATIGGRNAIDFLGLNPVMYMGNLSGSYGYMQYVTGLQTLLFQNLSGPLDFQVQSVSKLNLSATTATVGSNANYINLFNGTTFTAPNGANWNSDFIIPSSSAGTTTNVGGFYAGSLNIGGNSTLGVNGASVLTIPGTTITMANGGSFNSIYTIPVLTSDVQTNLANAYIGGSSGLTVAAPDGNYRLTPPSGVTNAVEGVSTIQKQTLWLYSGATNNPNGTSFAVNVNNTNANQRSFASIGVNVPASGACALFVTLGTYTNISSPVFNSSISTQLLNVQGMIPPGGSWYPTNITGASTIDQTKSIINGL